MNENCFLGLSACALQGRMPATQCASVLALCCLPFGFLLLCGWALHQSAYLPLLDCSHHEHRSVSALWEDLRGRPPPADLHLPRRRQCSVHSPSHTRLLSHTGKTLLCFPAPTRMYTDTHNTYTSLCGAPHPGFPVLPVCRALCKVLPELTACSKSTPLSRGSPWFLGVCRVRTVFKIVTCLLRRVDICTDDAEPVVSHGLGASPPL